MVRQGVGHDYQPVVELLCLVQGFRQADEVVPVACHKDPAFADRKPELLVVFEAATVDLVDRGHVEAEATADLRHRGVEVLVEEEAQVRQGRGLLGSEASRIHPGQRNLRKPTRYTSQMSPGRVSAREGS